MADGQYLTCPCILQVPLNCLGRLLCVPYDSGYGLQMAMQDGKEDGKMTTGGSSEGGSTETVSDWRLMAMVLDRIFFLIFAIIVVICSIALLHG